MLIIFATGCKASGDMLIFESNGWRATALLPNEH
jgi:hypothetical protein